MAHERPKLKAEPRQRTGTRYAKRLRSEGKLPVVVYGHGQAPAHIVISGEDFLHSLHRGAHLLDLDHNGSTETCLIKDVQYDYLGSQIIHADLARVDLNEEITVSVPLVLKGQDRSPGAKAPGAVIDRPMVDIEVRCLAINIPEQIVVDIAALDMDQTVTVGQLQLPEGVKTDLDAETIVVSITQAKEEVLEAPVGEAGKAEPEVITAKKEEAAGEGEAKKK